MRRYRVEIADITIDGTIVSPWRFAGYCDTDAEDDGTETSPLADAIEAQVPLVIDGYAYRWALWSVPVQERDLIEAPEEIGECVHCGAVLRQPWIDGEYGPTCGTCAAQLAPAEVN